MLTRKNLGIFLTTFIVGVTLGLMFKSALGSRPEVLIIQIFDSNIERPEFHGFNNDDARIDLDNKVALNDSETKIEPQFRPEIFGLKDLADDFVSPKYKIKLSDVADHGNNYRSKEVIARNGEKWLGLYSGDDGTYLENTKLEGNSG